MGKISVIIFIVIFFAVAYILVPIVMDNQKELKDFCREKEINGTCGSATIECYKNCENLGKEYFKYQGGGFGSSECWCKLNNETMQIW